MQKADREVFEAILGSQSGGERGVLATVVKVAGSVPRHEGAKMLVRADGSIVGTIGGGQMESRVIADALDVLASGDPRIAHYELVDPAAGDPGVCGGQVDIFLEPLVNEATLLVIGCGHVGKALAQLAHWMGWRVAVSDDREEFCNPDNIPEADVYLPVHPTRIPDEFTVTDKTYIAAVTRSVPLDVEFVPTLLATPAAYIGVMGSKRRWITTVKKMVENGMDEAALKRVNAPLGLELNAETPEEIAVSIMAEIISVRNGGTNQPMNWTGTPKAADKASLAPEN